MSGAITAPSVTRGPAAPTPALVVPLALAEARRLLRHPVTLVGFALWLTMALGTVLGHPTPLETFEAVGSNLSWFPGLPMVLAAYLVATREHRAGTLDVLAALPARAEQRVQALCLATLALLPLGLVANLGVYAVLRAQGAFAEVPPPVHLVQGPLTLVGAALVGVLLGTWAPTPVAPALGIVTLVGAHMALPTPSPQQLFGTTVFWADWGDYGGELWVGYVPGSPAAHLVYVTGLCGLAATAALLRVAREPGRAVSLGLVSLVLVVVGGLAQLP